MTMKLAIMLKFLRGRGHFLEHAVNPKAHTEDFFVGLNMNIAGTPFGSVG